MKFKIKNFGNIKEAEIELKNLTVFVGENNTNKTWTAYLIYAFFSKELFNKNIKTFLEWFKSKGNLSKLDDNSIFEYSLNWKKKNLKSLMPLFISKDIDLKNIDIDLIFSEKEKQEEIKRIKGILNKSNQSEEDFIKLLLMLGGILGLSFLISYYLKNKSNKSEWDSLLQILPFILLLFLPNTNNEKINFIEPFNIPA